MQSTLIETITYPIVETFHSVQGEGMWTGTNALFIRLGGCDVYCPWCDQKETWNAKRHPRRSLLDIVTEAKVIKCAIVVITGGEPLMHDLEPLTRQLRENGLRLHLETSGTHPFSGQFDWVTFSPKQYKSPHQSIYDRVSELKVVVATTEDLKWAEQQAAKTSPEVVKYLQPEWNTPASQQLIFDYVLEHPDWRISLQTHKLIGVR
jgi:organic radical activating enzyme